ncbi:MAG: FAS1-like dehydratase domain-containing protein [Betaproteobacteria bacterium]
MRLSSAIAGEAAGPLEHEVDARWLMAYSAGLGETDARYYDTERGVMAHPLFPVCYEWPVAQPLRALPALKPLFPQLLHAQHDLRLHRAPRAGDRLRLAARIVAVAQRKPGAFVVFRFAARDANGEPVTTTDFGALYRNVTVEGGDRQIDAVEDAPSSTGELSRVGELHIPANAAHVYTECARIWNPIHTDAPPACRPSSCTGPRRWHCLSQESFLFSALHRTRYAACSAASAAWRRCRRRSASTPPGRARASRSRRATSAARP